MKAMKHMEQLEILAMMLAPGDIPDSRLLAALNRPGLDWQALCRTASHHLVTPALAGSLDRKGLLAGLPDEVRNYLDAIRTLNRERNQTHLQELVRVAQALNAIGIEPLLLKGAIALLPDQYPGAGDRVLGDLDFVVPDERFEEVYSVIGGLGYEIAPDCHYSDAPQAHQGPYLMHRILPVKLEVHRRICHRELDDFHFTKELEVLSVMLDGNGTRVLIQDPASRLLHNFLHAQINDWLHAMHAVSIRQLVEFVQLRAHYGSMVDWIKLWQRIPNQYRRAFGHYLAVAEVLFKQPFPEAARRPRDTRLALYLWQLSTTSPGWNAFFRYQADPSKLPSRLSRLPRKIRMPGWLRQKIKSMREGGPL